jgi:hypothetical protein
MVQTGNLLPKKDVLWDVTWYIQVICYRRQRFCGMLYVQTANLLQKIAFCGVLYGTDW